MKIKLVKFEDDYAKFEIEKDREIFECVARISNNELTDFLDGNHVIHPKYWGDMNDDGIDQPEWFKRKELNLLNDAFEIGYKEIWEKMLEY